MRHLPFSLWPEGGRYAGRNFFRLLSPRRPSYFLLFPPLFPRRVVPAAPGRDRLLLYAIVNTLCQLPNVDAVFLLVEGESVEEFGGMAVNVPLEPNPDLVVS